MNTPIIQLAEQAGSTHKANLGVYQFYTHELEKFAELIVRECISKIENNAAQYDAPTWAFEIVNDIAEYFGVEE